MIDLVHDRDRRVANPSNDTLIDHELTGSEARDVVLAELLSEFGEAG